jgi:hypothetical protein
LEGGKFRLTPSCRADKSLHPLFRPPFTVGAAMRALILLAALVLLPGCRSSSVGYADAADSPGDGWWGLLGGLMQPLDDAIWRATGESDRARMYRHQEERNP